MNSFLRNQGENYCSQWGIVGEKKGYLVQAEIADVGERMLLDDKRQIMKDL